MSRWRWMCLSILLVSPLLAGFVFSVLGMTKLRTENPRKTSYMEYREQEWRRNGKAQKIHQIWVPLEKVSPYLIKAVIIAEDDKFWQHEGFDLEAIQKAIERDLKARRFRFGGSTISQQLTRNLFLTPEKSLLRKLQEAIITWGIERVLSKRRILELYLNVVEWGEGLFGVEAASRFYFGKSALALSAEESARMAAVLPNPRKYRPTGGQPYVASRSRVIYDIMVRRRIVIPEIEDAEKAREEFLAQEGASQSSEGEEESKFER